MSLHPTSRVDKYGGPASSGAFTWNNYLLAKWIEVFMISAGGGSQGGGLAATLAGGVGTAGVAGGGAIAYYFFPAAMLGLTVAIQVGAGGPGGAGAIVAGSGSLGTPGGNSSFGNFIVYGGQVGAGATTPNKGMFAG